MSQYAVYNGPVSAGLAKRLAEAAHGLSGKKYYYLIAERLEFPFKIRKPGGGDTLEEANLNANDKIDQDFAGKTVYKFGPYEVSPLSIDIGYNPEMEYDRVEIKLLKGDVVKYNTVVENPDAIVFSLSTFDKFFLPYYTRLYGIQEVNNIREKVKKLFSGDNTDEELQPLPKFMACHTMCTGIIDVS